MSRNSTIVAIAVGALLLGGCSGATSVNNDQPAASEPEVTATANSQTELSASTATVESDEVEEVKEVKVLTTSEALSTDVISKETAAPSKVILTTEAEQAVIAK